MIATRPTLLVVLSFLATLCTMLAAQADDGIQLGELLAALGAALVPGGLTQRAVKVDPPAPRSS